MPISKKYCTFAQSKVTSLVIKKTTTKEKNEKNRFSSRCFRHGAVCYGSAVFSPDSSRKDVAFRVCQLRGRRAQLL
jgi:hypothetical protein